MKQIVIDATNHRLGRLASRVAKLLLKGERVVIVNAEKAVITGSERAVLERYLMLIQRTAFASLSKIKVWYPRRPDRILWYTIARMLPRKKPKGREALKRLRVYVGTPSEFSGVPLTVFEDALHKSEVNRSGKLVRTVTLERLSALIGGRGVKT